MQKSMISVGTLLLTSTLFLTGCISVGAVSPKPVHDYCALTSYITVVDADKLTEATAEEIEDHNELREDRCE